MELKLQHGGIALTHSGGRLITNEWQLLPLAQLVTLYLKETGAGVENTQRSRESALKLMLAYLGRKQSIMSLSLSDLTAGEVEGFIDYRFTVGDAPATVALRHAHIRAFGRWVRSHIPAYSSPAHLVAAPTVEKRAYVGITRDDAEALIAESYKHRQGTVTGDGAGFAVAFLLATGLRAQEVLDAVESQLSPDCRWLLNHRTKGKKYRKIYLPAYFQPFLLEWLKQRAEILSRFKIKDTGPYPLIISLYGAEKADPLSFRMNKHTLWRIVSTAANVKGLTHCHPRKLRHTFAHHLLDETRDIRLVAQALGHSRIETTMIYTERSDEEFAAELDRVGAIGGRR